MKIDREPSMWGTPTPGTTRRAVMQAGRMGEYFRTTLRGRRSRGSTLRGIVAVQDEYGNISYYDDGGNEVVTETPPTIYTATGSGGGAIVTAAPVTTTDSGSWWDKILNALPKATQFYNAQQIAQENIRRAKAGLQPINPALYSPQVGLALSPQTSQLLMYGALGIGAVLLLSGRRKGRR